MEVFKCDRCGKYYLNNNDELNKPLIYIGYDDIDLCDDCLGELQTWVEMKCFWKNQDLEVPSEIPTQRWIPCSERLPEFHQHVILCLRSLDVQIGFRAETEPYFYAYSAGSGYIDSQNVLAWQPLPEPYKESEENESI